MIPQKANVYQSVPLTNISLAYKNKDYICEAVFPTVQVVKDTAQIFSQGMENLRIVNTYRAVGAKGNIVETTLSKAEHYSLEDHVIGEMIPEEIIENQDAPINAEIIVTEALTDRIYIDKEKSLADTLGNTSIITQNTTLSGTSQFNDYTNSDPVSIFKTARAAVRAGSGKVPNSIIISWATLNTLLFHPQIASFFPGAPAVTKDMLEQALPRIFGFEKMYVGSALYNNSNQGGTDTLTDIWGKNIVIAYIEDRPTLMSRSLGFTYQKKAPRYVEKLGKNSGSLELIRAKSDYIQVSDKYDMVLVDEKCGYLIKNAIA